MTTLEKVETANRWTDAVLKLINLTQAKKLEWSREADSLLSPAYTIRYSAKLGEQQFELSVDISDPHLGMVSNRYFASLGTRRTIDGHFGSVSLKVFSLSGKGAINFPDIPALEGLGAVVYRQASGPVEDILQAIEAI